MSAVEIVTLRFPVGLKQEIAEVAKAQGNSMNRQVVDELRRAINLYERSAYKARDARNQTLPKPSNERDGNE